MAEIQGLAEKFKQHDKFQFEMKFTYPAPDGHGSAEYNVDTFMFIPENLDINPSNYTKDDFYEATHGYIRLKTPQILLRNISSGENAPLSELGRAVRSLASDNSPAALEIYSQSMKMFCSIIKSALRDGEAFLERNPPGADTLSAIDRFLSEAQDTVEKFRAFKPDLQLCSLPDSARELFAHSDEFLSITMNKYRAKLWRYLNAAPDLPGFHGAKRSIYDEIRAEIQYRKQCAYPSVPDPKGDNELLVYREGVLKKAMAGVLFLKTDLRRDGVLLENIMFGLAAGVAMAFATAIAYLTKSFFVQEFSLAVVVILVVAYMGKDRIKELLRAYLRDKIKRHIYDYKIRIFDSNGRKVGLARENFSFVPDVTLPREVLKIRARAPLSNLENDTFGEQVIHARKNVVLGSGVCRRTFCGAGINGIVDITRFNISKFLRTMDNPEKVIYIPDENGSIVSKNARRVYHVNVVVRYGMSGCAGDSYARFRIVMARDGIQRVDVFPIVMA